MAESPERISQTSTELMKAHVLIVEDEPGIVELLSYNLQRNDYDVAVAVDGEEAMIRIAERPPDVILLDWMLPHVSGLEVCRRLRRHPETRGIPIIILTARGEESDKMRGLDSGADDYVTKPFSMSELLARIRAVIRRTRPALSESLLEFEDIVVDLVAHRVTRDGRPIHLGPTEFRLLRFLMEHPRRVFSREKLLDAVWGHDAAIEPRTVDVHIRRLRKALNGPQDDDLIRTVRSFGYALDAVTAVHD